MDRDLPPLLAKSDLYDVRKLLADPILPQTENYFVNKKGYKIHFRHFIPKDIEQIEALVIYTHGYDSHINNACTIGYGEGLRLENYAFVTFDFHGNGYSDGVRAYYECMEDVIDDAVDFVKLFTTEGGFKGEYFCTLSAWEMAKIRSLPFCFSGLSLGGATALLLGLLVNANETAGGSTSLLTNTNGTINNSIGAINGNNTDRAEEELLTINPGQTPAPPAPTLQAASAPNAKSTPLPPPLAPDPDLPPRNRFLGTLLLAPAIRGNPPPACVVWLLRNSCLKCCPLGRIPSFLDTVAVPAAIWADARDRARFTGDRLRWTKTMRLRTGMTMMDMVGYLEENLHRVSFPFMVLHDPGDRITQYSGTDLLFRRSSTAPEAKRIVDMTGSLHDLVANELVKVVVYTKEFVSVRLGAMGRA